MLSTGNIMMQFAGKPLFEDVSVKFESGGHYGLIGANGSGKSTFMKILAGTLEPSAGQVVIPPNLRVASLSQDQSAFDQYTVLDATVMGHAELWKIKHERDEIYALPEMSEDQGMRVAELEMEYAELDGYSAESRAGELLTGVDIPVELHEKKMAEIPSGLKLRVLLTQVLFSNPDIMLLDEPTNNLDINTIRWLERSLTGRDCTMIIISHDRHFLNSVCTHTADLDYGKIQLFPGTYDEYMLAATQAKARIQTENAKKKAKVQELQDFVRRFSANASKAKQATSRQKIINELKGDMGDVKPSSRRYPYLKFKQEKKLHRVALTLTDMTNGYDDAPALFTNMKMMLDAGQKLAVIGPNGIGKTSLLKTIMGEIPLRSGEVKWSENASIGYFAQDHNHLFQGKETLYDWMAQWGKEEDDEQVIRGILGRMLFSGDALTKPVSVLSGGEKVRLILGKFILQLPNILLLDEPTNHLDMESIESLNMALEEYEGTIIVVSHDRQLVSSIATQILELKPGGRNNYYLGDYESYLENQQD